MTQWNDRGNLTGTALSDAVAEVRSVLRDYDHPTAEALAKYLCWGAEGDLREAAAAHELYGLPLTDRLSLVARELVRWLDALSWMPSRPGPAAARLEELAGWVGLTAPTPVELRRRLWQAALAALPEQRPPPGARMRLPASSEGREALRRIVADPSPWQAALDDPGLLARAAPAGYRLHVLLNVVAVVDARFGLPDYVYQVRPSRRVVRLFLVAAPDATAAELARTVVDAVVGLYGQAAVPVTLLVRGVDGRAGVDVLGPAGLDELYRRVADGLLVGSLLSVPNGKWWIDEDGWLTVAERPTLVAYTSVTGEDPDWARLGGGASDVSGRAGAKAPLPDEEAAGPSADRQAPEASEESVIVAPTPLRAGSSSSTSPVDTRAVPSLIARHSEPAVPSAAELETAPSHASPELADTDRSPAGSSQPRAGSATPGPSQAPPGADVFPSGGRLAPRERGGGAPGGGWSAGGGSRVPAVGAFDAAGEVVAGRLRAGVDRVASRPPGSLGWAAGADGAVAWLRLAVPTVPGGGVAVSVLDELKAAGVVVRPMPGALSLELAVVDTEVGWSRVAAVLETLRGAGLRPGWSQVRIASSGLTVPRGSVQPVLAAFVPAGWPAPELTVTDSSVTASHMPPPASVGELQAQVRLLATTVRMASMGPNTFTDSSSAGIARATVDGLFGDPGDRDQVAELYHAQSGWRLAGEHEAGSGPAGLQPELPPTVPTPDRTDGRGEETLLSTVAPNTKMDSAPAQQGKVVQSSTSDQSGSIVTPTLPSSSHPTPPTPDQPVQGASGSGVSESGVAPGGSGGGRGSAGDTDGAGSQDKIRLGSLFLSTTGGPGHPPDSGPVAGSAGLPPAAPSLAVGPDLSTVDLISGLRAAEVPEHRRYVGMEGPGAQRLRELVGPDIYGRRIPAAARPFMTGFFDELPAGTMPGLARQLPPVKVAGFLRNLSMTQAAPDRRDMELSTLASEPVASAHRDPRLRDWARPEPSAGVTGPERAPRLETDLLTAPLVVSSIWLGSPLSDKSNMDEAFNGKVAKFWENLAETARTYRGVIDVVLFTDIGRETFDRVRDLAGRPADAYLAEVWDMLTRARGDGQYTVHLVNVDEVFNAELVSGAAGVFDPELLTLVREMFAIYRMEADSPDRQGLGKASDILRTLVGLVFGGLYSDADNIVDVSLSADELVGQMNDILAGRRGFAMELFGNAFFAPAGHPFLVHHLREQRRRYDLTVDELFGGGDRAARERRQRRSSTEVRTAIMFESARELFGTEEVAGVDFVLLQSAATWTAPPPGRGWPADPQRALANAERYVSALIRQLFRRDGALDLLKVADAIALQPNPETMWLDVLGYLGDSPFASLVTKVVDGRIERLFPVGEISPVTPVDLPPRAANLLVVDTDPAREARDLGGRVRPGRFAGTQQPYDPGHMPDPADDDHGDIDVDSGPASTSALEWSLREGDPGPSSHARTRLDSLFLSTTDRPGLPPGRVPEPVELRRRVEAAVEPSDVGVADGGSDARTAAGPMLLLDDQTDADTAVWSSGSSIPPELWLPATRLLVPDDAAEGAGARFAEFFHADTSVDLSGPGPAAMAAGVGRLLHILTSAQTGAAQVQGVAGSLPGTVEDLRAALPTELRLALDIYEPQQREQRASADGTGDSTAEAAEQADQVAQLRRLYRQYHQKRTSAGGQTPTVDLWTAINDLQGQVARLNPDDGPVARRLHTVRRDALDLMTQVYATPDRLSLSTLLTAARGLPEPDRASAAVSAVQSLGIRLDAAQRAGVRRVELDDLPMTPSQLEHVRRWFPNAVVVNSTVALPPEETFTGAHSAPWRVDLAAVRARLSWLAGQVGGRGELGRRVGVQSGPQMNQLLLDLAYLTAAVYGEQFTERNLTTVRRLVDAPLVQGKPRVSDWDGFADLARQARGDDPARPGPVDRKDARRLADAAEQIRLGRPFRITDLGRAWPGTTPSANGALAGTNGHGPANDNGSTNGNGSVNGHGSVDDDGSNGYGPVSIVTTSTDFLVPSPDSVPALPRQRGSAPMPAAEFERSGAAVRQRLADGDDPVPMQPAGAFAGLPGADEHAVQMRVRFGADAAGLGAGRRDETVLEPRTGDRVLDLTVVDTAQSWADMARSLRAVRAARLVARSVDIFVSAVAHYAPTEGERLEELIRRRWRELYARLVEAFPSAAASELWPAGAELIMPGLATQTSAGVLQAQAKLALALVLAAKQGATADPGPEGLIGGLFASPADRAQAAELYHALNATLTTRP